MKTLSPEQYIKKQKKIIILLSIFLTIISVIFISIEIYINIPKNPIEITFNEINLPQHSTSYKIEIDIKCKNPTIINVKDFSYKINEQSNEYKHVNSIVYKNKEYQQDEAFVIYPNTINKLIINYITIKSNEIYYKFQKIEYNTTKKFSNKS